MRDGESTSDSNTDFFYLPANDSIIELPNEIQKIVFKKTAGTATGDIEIYASTYES